MTPSFLFSTLVLTGGQVALGLFAVATLLASLIMGIKFYWKQQQEVYFQEASQMPHLSKKYRAVDVRQYSANIKLLSLVSAISMVLLIFAWTHYSNRNLLEGNGLVLEGVEHNVPVTTHDEPPKLPALPPPPVQSAIIQEVDEEPLTKVEPIPDPVVTTTTTGSVNPNPVLSLGSINIEPEPEPMAPEAMPIDITWGIVEQMPRFPGCEAQTGSNNAKKKCADQKMLSFIYDNINYPLQAREVQIEGIVVVSFVVDKTGKIKDIELLKDPGAGLGKEAVRIVRMMNQLPEAWTPGKQRGQTVKVKYNLPIHFTLH